MSRAPAYARRSRRELAEAVGAGIGILALTGICIWAMRPGGIAGRQPRAILLGLIVAAVFAAGWWLLTAPGRRFEDRKPVAMVITAAIAVGVAILGAVVWPGGLVVDEPTPQPLVPDPVTDTAPPSPVPPETPPNAPPETPPAPPGP